MEPISIGWMKIPKKTRQKLLNNSFCVDCGGFTKITDFSVEEDYFGLIIQGKCHLCRQEIVRVLER